MTCLVAAGAAVSPSPAAGQERRDDSWPVPTSANITISGHGYGHGRGMSQYGAEGAARAGLGANRILGFYYPGTEQGRAGGRMRVLLTAATSDQVIVRSRSRLGVRTGGKDLDLPDNGADRWRLTADGDSGTVIWFRDGGWQRWRAVAGDAAFDAGDRPIRMVTSDGVQKYRGRLELARIKSGSRDRDVVNSVAMDDYLRGVVPLEMPASWSPAAVQAQAIAARTYAAYERAHPRAGHYHLCDTTSCQVYGGVSAEHPDSDAAVAATTRRVRLYDGDPAFTQFSASSGGWTVRGSAPYLDAKRDKYDDWSGNPVHSWSVKVTDRSIERAYPKIGNLRRIVVADRDGNGEWNGRVLKLRLVGSQGTRTVDGESFRFALGLRSSWITFSVS